MATPKCGDCRAPAPTNRSAWGGLVLAIVVLGLFGIICDGGDKGTPAKDWRSESNSGMAYIMMEDFVRDRLKAPRTAHFPGVFDNRDEHVTFLGSQKYRIVSYVDSENSFGAMIRTRFVGEIKQVEEDRWQLISLDFQDR